MSSLYEMEKEIRVAKRTLDNAEEASDSMARILKGRLRKVSPSALADLKKELSQFNAKTQTWKN